MMDLALDGRTALVTGASSGIGSATTRALAEEGVRVALCARREPRLRALAEQLPRPSSGPHEVVVADLSTRDQPADAVRRAAAAFGRLDIVVNCATDTRVGHLSSYTDAEIEQALQTKPIGYLRVCREAADWLTSPGGVIVNIAGTSAESAPRAYTVSVIGTAGTVGFTRALADELADRGIRVVAVNPGAVRSERFQSHLERFAEQEGRSIEDVERDIASRIPLGRILEPDDISRVVAFLASDVAAAVNGSVVTVDGGMSRAVG